MTITAKVIEDSIGEAGKRITTMQLMYPRFIHSEFMTHRVFSRNASSSRAIPTAKLIEQVLNEPAMPVYWGKNIPGMQAAEELTGEELAFAKETWKIAAAHAVHQAKRMADAGAHKQIVNRILEPFLHIHVVVTATEWENFFELRDHQDAQPEIRALAIEVRNAMEASEPKLLKAGEWHLPYVTAADLIAIELHLGCIPNASRTLAMARKVSAARCCRVSYLKHDGSRADIEEDIALCDRLIGSRPLHASPFEHQATPDVLLDRLVVWECPELHGNLVGWIQNRKLIESSLSN